MKNVTTERVLKSWLRAALHGVEPAQAVASAQVWRWALDGFVVRQGEHTVWLTLTGEAAERVLRAIQLPELRPGSMGAALPSCAEEVVRAPVGGLVVAVHTSVGEHISPNPEDRAGATVATVECMKTEYPVIMQGAGTITRIVAPPGSVVAAGDIILEFSPEFSPAHDIVDTCQVMQAAAPDDAEILHAVFQGGSVPDDVLRDSIERQPEMAARLLGQSMNRLWPARWDCDEPHADARTSLVGGISDSEQLRAVSGYADETSNRAADGDRYALFEPALWQLFVASRWRAFAANRAAQDQLFSATLAALGERGAAQVTVPENTQLAATIYPKTGSAMTAQGVRVPDDAELPRQRFAALCAAGRWKNWFGVEAVNPTPDAPASEADSKRMQQLRRGVIHPAFVLSTVLGEQDTFVEYRERRGMVPVAWQPDVPRSSAAAVFGLVLRENNGDESQHTRHMPKYVFLCSDPTRNMASLTNAECDVVEAALTLAEQEQCDVVWFATSSGARIDMKSGTENLDGTARALRRIALFSRGPLRIHAVAMGPCVGAQAYWLSAACIAMGSRGTLVMTERGSLILSGRRALEVSGGVPAASERALGGYEVLGPVGQAAFGVQDITAAWALLRRRMENPAAIENDPRPALADTLLFASTPDQSANALLKIGDVFDDEKNKGRRRAWPVAPLLHRVLDIEPDGSGPLCPWSAWVEARQAVVMWGRIAGRRVTLIGVDNQATEAEWESSRAQGQTFAAGTLYPASSRKIARAIHAASGREPVIVFANMAGFDGSAWSLAAGQLEFGAEVATAVATCESPILVVVLTRYHGGAFVVFSRQLNPVLQSIAIKGSQASVIGGGAAATVVFSADIQKRTQAAGGGAEARAAVLQELAQAFDAHHSMERAQQAGSVDRIISLHELPSALAEFVGRGPKG
jgi:acetyl-CoA carboxylase carboxyltransferase component/biotin carboxyl carrier protein